MDIWSALVAIVLISLLFNYLNRRLRQQGLQRKQREHLARQQAEIDTLKRRVEALEKQQEKCGEQTLSS